MTTLAEIRDGKSSIRFNALDAFIINKEDVDAV